MNNEEIIKKSISDLISKKLTNNDTLQEWWNKMHIDKRDDWLSNSAIHTTLGNVNISPEFIKLDFNILVIGVGLGTEVEGLYKKGYKVWALDISDVTLKKLKESNRIKDYWTIDNMDNMPENFFDLVISDFVVQHMNNANLLKQLKQILKCLKDTGIYAFQYIIRKDEEFDESIKSQIWGHVRRTEDEVKKLIAKAKGKIIYIDKCRIHMAKG